MRVLRWILFVPFGFLIGWLFAIPVILFHSIANWDNIFWMSVIKNGVSVYFGILGCAWIVPKNCSPHLLKTIVSILFGSAIVLTLLAFLGEQTWEYAGEILGISLGYLGATVWDKNGIIALLQKTKGAHPLNAYSIIVDP
jgi:hypothetical protein